MLTFPAMRTKSFLSTVQNAFRDENGIMCAHCDAISFIHTVSFILFQAKNNHRVVRSMRFNAKMHSLWSNDENYLCNIPFS